MGVRIVAGERSGFAISAPVPQNSNHLRTAFGGSINAVAVLAAYSFLWLELRDQGMEVVIRESSIRFLRPIRETIRAVCLRPDPAKLEKFRDELRTNGKARIALQVSVEEKAILAAKLDGVFVAFRSVRGLR